MIRGDYEGSGTGFIELQSLDPSDSSAGFGSFPDWDETNVVLTQKRLVGSRARLRCCFALLCSGLLLALVIATLVYYSQCWTSQDEFALLKNLKLLGTNQAIPLAKAHSHNDYLQAQPLEEALAEGFCSVEADVFFDQGDLYIGHAYPTEKTLTELYLDPLATRATKASGHLQPVYRKSKLLGIKECSQLTLLVDFKHIPGVGSPELVSRIPLRAHERFSFQP